MLRKHTLSCALLAAVLLMLVCHSTSVAAAQQPAGASLGRKMLKVSCGDGASPHAASTPCLPTSSACLIPHATTTPALMHHGLLVLQASHQVLAQGRNLLGVRDKDDIFRIRANILVSGTARLTFACT
jgi:hypothetical protein